MQFFIIFLFSYNIVEKKNFWFFIWKSKIKNFTGAKIIGATGLLKHSLAILVLYLDAIALWVTSNKEQNDIPTLAYTSKRNSIDNIELIYDEFWIF